MHRGEDVNFNAHNRDLKQVSELRGIPLFLREERNPLPVECVNAATTQEMDSGRRTDRQELIAACRNDCRFAPASYDGADAFLLSHDLVRKYRLP